MNGSVADDEVKPLFVRIISDLNAQLEYERIRREKLEGQLDELRLENSRLRDEIDMMNAANQVREILPAT